MIMFKPRLSEVNITARNAEVKKTYDIHRRRRGMGRRRRRRMGRRRMVSPKM
jgi:hypothetical protein